jgi:hypothetical protein
MSVSHIAQVSLSAKRGLGSLAIALDQLVQGYLALALIETLASQRFQDRLVHPVSVFLFGFLRHSDRSPKPDTCDVVPIGASHLPHLVTVSLLPFALLPTSDGRLAGASRPCSGRSRHVGSPPLPMLTWGQTEIGVRQS